MKYIRRYLQFNDLVIDTYDMHMEGDSEAGFKGSGTEYSFGHGEYRPFKSNYLFLKPGTVNLSIRLDMKKLPCEYRPFYRNLAVTELSQPGKLWAVQNNGLVWAYAVATSYHEVKESPEDRLDIEIDFALPEGVWHKADKQKTFLLPYDVCTLFDCKGYREVQPCKDSTGDCCLECMGREALRQFEEDCSCCCCDEISKDMALCHHLAEMQDFYKECVGTYQIKYDCEKGEELFGDEYLGEKICSKDSCGGIIAGRFYSETDIPTTADIVITGKMHNPTITINGNENTITGDYERLRIEHTGDIYSLSECCDGELLSPSLWQVRDDMDYGWTIKQGVNSIMVDMGERCDLACVYIQSDNLTI